MNSGAKPISEVVWSELEGLHESRELLVEDKRTKGLLTCQRIPRDSGPDAEQKAGGHSVSKFRDSRDKETQDREPDDVPIDPQGEQRELEAGGWERVEDAQGKVFWVNPESGHRYPQGPAIRRMRQMQEDADGGDE
jgi:hypothetical protein